MYGIDDFESFNQKPTASTITGATSKFDGATGVKTSYRV